MRPLAYLAALLLALPQLFLAAAFGLLTHLTSGHTLGSLFMRALSVVFALFSWKGLLLLVGFGSLIALGFSVRLRWFGAGLLALLVVGSAALLIAILHQTMSIADVWIFLPGAAALALAIRLIVLDPPQGIKKDAASHKNLPTVSF